MAEGAIVVPLYSRQAVGELAGMIKDCGARLLIHSEPDLAEAIARIAPDGTRQVTFDEAFEKRSVVGAVAEPPNGRAGSDFVTIIYTSGTSGEPKGVCLTVSNLNHMLGCTTERLDQLMYQPGGKAIDSVFHYLPMNFAESWLRMLS